MLGKTANGMFWMFRNFERAENVTRLIDAGLRMALTRSREADSEWRSVLAVTGGVAAFEAAGRELDGAQVADWLLRGRDNAASVRAMIAGTRTNARLVRTAITRELWEAVNECWLVIDELLRRAVPMRDLSDVLGIVRRQSGLVRGALHGTMLRNDIYNFARLGTFVERADNTARILDVKYHVLLPSVSYVGSSLDNVQWDNILRSLSGQSAFRWLNEGRPSPAGITHFLIFDRRFPRSLAFCLAKTRENLGHLASSYGERLPAHDRADALAGRMAALDIDSIFERGLHQFIGEFIACNAALGRQIETDYRFYA